MTVEGVDAVVGVSIAVVAVVFLASVVALVLVCRHKYCRSVDMLTCQQTENRPDVNLVGNMEGTTELQADVELSDVGVPNLDDLLQDDAWVDDATGLVPHCLAILKTCHSLTEKLVGLTMGNAQQLQSPETLVDIVAIARRITPRVDQVVKSMYPPLDPRLLEARCTALVLSVSHLVLVTKNACRLSGVLDWIDQALADVEEHLKLLREASLSYEAVLQADAIANIQQQDQQPHLQQQQLEQQLEQQLQTPDLQLGTINSNIQSSSQV